MSERERLIELLKQTCHCKDEDCSNCSSNGICFTHREADYLLENGVIVPPVKIGDTFFRTLDWKNCIDKCIVSSLTQKSNKTWKIRLTSGEFRSVFEITINDIGKTVFLTKEEAEKALKGGVE